MQGGRHDRIPVTARGAGGDEPVKAETGHLQRRIGVTDGSARRALAIAGHGRGCKCELGRDRLGHELKLTDSRSGQGVFDLS